MIISEYIIWFFIYSMAGWLFETTRAVIVKHKWENRGFLYGPLCPIYGVGGVGITIVMDYFGKINGSPLTAWQVFLISYLGSIVLEFGTSYVLEKLFHAVWWDYSDMPFNIQGRICLPASIAFGLVGVAIMYGPSEWLSELTRHFSEMTIIVVSLIAVALSSSDLTLTVSSLANYNKRVQAKYDSFNKAMDAAVNEFEEKSAEQKQKREEEKEKFRRRLERLKKDTMANHVETVINDTDGFGKSAVKRVKRFVPYEKHGQSDTMKNEILEKFKTAVTTKHYTQK